jgi:hypothetical protein
MFCQPAYCLKKHNKTADKVSELTDKISELTDQKDESTDKIYEFPQLQRYGKATAHHGLYIMYSMPFVVVLVFGRHAL